MKAPPAAPPDTAVARNNFRGGAWLLADMSLNIWALAIVKTMGVDLPTVQLVRFVSNSLRLRALQHYC